MRVVVAAATTDEVGKGEVASGESARTVIGKRQSKSSVIDALANWGPDSSQRTPITMADAESYCGRLATTHYENFPIASALLPRRLRQHFYNVYAYCRWADDMSDETGDAVRSLELLAWWRDELEACYEGRVWHPVFVALESTITEFNIPQQPFDDLISAFEQDQHVREYETFDQLLEYCTRSANPVGRVVLHLCEASRDETIAWSDSVCTGLQLANFWQDVSRDADIGRTYLPREDRQRFGYTKTDLEQRVTNDAFLNLMRFEVDRAREFLVCGQPLVEEMPGRMQVNIEMFLRGGLQILDEIETIGHRVWETRPIVSKPRLARLFVGCIGRALKRRGK